MDLDLILEANLAPAQITELGVLAEGYGFRAIWAQNYARARDAFMSIVPMAMATKKIKVGVVVVSPYEMHPLKITNAVLTLNEYAGGRAAVVGAIDEPFLTYDGQVYSSKAFLKPWYKVRERPQVYFGASGPKLLRMAAERADGVMMSDMPPAMMAPRLAMLREGLAANDRGVEGFRISNFVAWHVKPDAAASRREATSELMIRGWLETDWLTPFLAPGEVQIVRDNLDAFLYAFRTKAGKVEGVPKAIVDRLVDELTLAGDFSSIDSHITRLRQYAAAGFTEIALRVHEDPADAIRLIGERVLPALQ
ncbi:MAG: LLM class flavin-dependent oxidoreductase [Gammaproteobacteria bacterium]|nr:LLM class flavin-dependent oxidoreductase [Gammaproteobacteria bacterium]